MKKFVKAISVILALSVCMASFVACGNAPASPAPSGSTTPSSAVATEPAKKESSGVVTIFSRTGPDSSEWLRVVAEKFTAQTGIKIEFLEQGQSGYFTNITNQLVAGTDSFDLGVTNSTYIGPWAYAGYIDPIDEYVGKFDPSFALDDMAFEYKIDGKRFAIPYSVSAHMLYYRSDLIATPPATWDEYLEMGKKFTQSINASSPTKYGLAWTSKAGPEQPKTFYNYLWSLGGEIVVDGKSAVASEAGLRAGKYWDDIVKAKIAPPDIANYSYPETLDALTTGTVAMAAPYWSAGYSDIQKGNSPHKANLKVAMLPGVKQADGSVKAVSFNHSYTLVLNKNAKNKPDAMKFYEFLCNKENQLEYAKINGFPARYSALKDPSLDRSFFDVALKCLECTKFEPLVPYYLEQHDIMNNALSGIMTQTVDYKTALTDAQSDLDKLYQSYKK